MAWTRKYRPFNLHNILGNQYIREKLSTMFIANNLPQALMITGERGTGKTSLARILATTLYCTEAVDGTACGSCATCTTLKERFIVNGETVRGISIYEFDITKLNKREDIEQIVVRIQQRLVTMQPTVFILDEIQRASPEAQSCFLKVLEEPNPNVYIILCTTDEQKLIKPLLSRFHEVRLSRPSKRELYNHITDICEAEGVDYEEAAVYKVIEKYQGIPREVLNKMEFISLTGPVTKVNVSAELNTGMYTHYQTFFNACMAGKLHRVMGMLSELTEEEQVDYGGFLEGLSSFLTDTLKVRAGVHLDRFTADELRILRPLGKRLSLSDISHLLHIFNQVRQTSAFNEFTLTALALQVMQVLAKEEALQAQAVTETPEQVARTYQEVTHRVLEEQTNAPQGEPLGYESFAAIFGVENVGALGEGTGGNVDE